MPNIPRPFKMRDWREVARALDTLVFDFEATGPFMPLIWVDGAQRNFKQDTFGIQTVLGDPRMGPGKNVEAHEGILCIASVLGASLIGMDKRNQGGRDYVRMCDNYFGRDAGNNIFQNRTTAGHCGSFWYAIFPNVLYFSLSHCYPDHGRSAKLMRMTADQFRRCSEIFTKPEWHTSYNFRTHRPESNGKLVEGDGAAGVSWILYMAHAKFGDPAYLEGSRRCMDFLQREKRNPLYEVILPFGAYLAARMNAEIGTEYDVTKLLNWCLSGRSVARPGWGVIVGRWGEYDVSGLVGSTTDGGGYAFAMNTFDMVAALVPLARYDQRYARAIGKLVLNTANAARLFYPDGLPPGLQTCHEHGAPTRNVVAYEGLRKVGLRRQDRDKTPCACGDPLGGRWGRRDYPSDLSLYGSAHVGLMAAVINRTDDEKILRLDCLKTDFFHDEAYPTYLCFNPYPEDREVRIDAGVGRVDLYDAVSRRFVGRNVRGRASVRLARDSAAVIVLAPAGGRITRDGKSLLVDGVVVDFGAGREQRSGTVPPVRATTNGFPQAVASLDP